MYGGQPALVLSTACGQNRCGDCETPHCGCLCHEPGGINYTGRRD